MIEVGVRKDCFGLFLCYYYCFVKDLGFMNQVVFFVGGGLLCILYEFMCEIGEDDNFVKYVQMFFFFIVWNLLMNKWKEFLFCKYNVCCNYMSFDSVFIYVFCDIVMRFYKILCMLKDYINMGVELLFMIEIYDFRMGKWKECVLYDGERMCFSFGSGQGVYCDGVVYFQLWWLWLWILFCFDVVWEKWSEEDFEQWLLRLFEWNGMLMMMLLLLDSWNKYELVFVYCCVENWWIDVGIVIFFEVWREFFWGEEVVVCGNFLCLSGYDCYGMFKIVVYDKEENFWCFLLFLLIVLCKYLLFCEFCFVFWYMLLFIVELQFGIIKF